MTRDSQNASRLLETLGYLLMAGGMAMAVAAPIILLIEVGEWLFRMEWPGLTVADGLSLFGIEHEVAETEGQRLLDVVMAFPLALALFFVGISMFLGGINLADRSLKRSFVDEYLGDD